jgi:predicted phage-related endonuclease
MLKPFLTLEHKDRRSFIGGSDACTIMGNDESALVRLWRESEAR